MKKKPISVNDLSKKDFKEITAAAKKKKNVPLIKGKILASDSKPK